ncbi:MAG: hypothetical protein V1818_04575 [Candidatus Aenigmatarchaeota archaeon]
MGLKEFNSLVLDENYKPNIENSTTYRLEELDSLTLDEKHKPDIEGSTTDGLKEIALLGYNDKWIYVYKLDNFIDVFSDIFQCRFSDYDPRPDSMMHEKYKKMERGSDLQFRMLFKEGKHRINCLEMGLLPEYVEIKDEKRRVNIAGWPVKRKMYSGSLNKREPEEIDLLTLISNYLGAVNQKEVLERLDKHMKEEWQKLHGNKKPIYRV